MPWKRRGGRWMCHRIALQRPHRAHRRSAAEAYFDPRRYERELQRIWYRNWIYVGRSSDVAAKRAFRPSRSATRKSCWCATIRAGCRLSITPAATAAPSCARERGDDALRGDHLPLSRLGVQPAGRACCAPPRRHARGFDLADYPLYGVKVREWSGFIFVALTDSPPPFERLFDLPLNRLDAWPLRIWSSGTCC
jgi:phenylpropionate dioxygenase-like ring-hydroxylating dioxygenase large terminal subunit